MVSVALYVCGARCLESKKLRGGEKGWPLKPLFVAHLALVHCSIPCKNLTYTIRNPSAATCKPG